MSRIWVKLLGDLLFAHHPLLVHRELRGRLDVERVLLGLDGLELGLGVLVVVLVRFDHLLFLDGVRLEPDVEFHVEEHADEALCLLLAVPTSRRMSYSYSMASPASGWLKSTRARPPMMVST